MTSPPYEAKFFHFLEFRYRTCKCFKLLVIARAVLTTCAVHSTCTVLFWTRTAIPLLIHFWTTGPSCNYHLHSCNHDHHTKKDFQMTGYAITPKVPNFQLKTYGQHSCTFQILCTPLLMEHFDLFGMKIHKSDLDDLDKPAKTKFFLFSSRSSLGSCYPPGWIVVAP